MANEHPIDVKPEEPCSSPHPIGLREMTLTESDMEELQRRIEYPSATPRIPFRAVPEEEADELD